MLPKSDLICLHYIAGPAKASHIAAVWKPLASRGHLIATKTFAFESVFAWHNFQDRPLLLWPNTVRLDTRVKLGLIRQFILDTVLAKKEPPFSGLQLGQAIHNAFWGETIVEG